MKEVIPTKMRDFNFWFWYWKNWIEHLLNKRRNEPRRFTVIVIIVLMMLGAALRLFGMPGGMLYSIDQARDYRIAANVLEEGIGSLPLLGPLAGGTDFRLGPIHNYMHLPGLWLTGAEEPFGIVIVEMIVSIGLIPLVYIFMRGFFGRWVSLVLTAHVALGLLFVAHSRFTWNPNSIPFFVTLLILSAWYLQERALRWRVMAIIALAVSASVLMQLHTITFAIVPIVFILWQWRFRLLQNTREWGIALFILSLLFLPVFLSEYLTHFALIKAFFEGGTSRIDSWLDLAKGVYKMLYDLVWYHMIVLTSYDFLPEIARLESSKSIGLLIDRNDRLTVVLGLGMGVVIFVWRWLWREMLGRSKVSGDRIRIVAILVMIALIIITPLSLKSDTRYFHVIYFLPLLAYGCVLTRVLTRPVGKYAGGLGALILLAVSCFSSVRWVDATSHYHERYDPSFRLTVLEEYYITNVRQYEEMSDFITKEVQTRQAHIVYGAVPIYEERALTVMLLSRHNIILLPILHEYWDKQGMYIAVRHAEKIKSGKDLSSELTQKFTVDTRKDFGTLTLFILEPREAGSFIPMTDELRDSFIHEYSYQAVDCEPGTSGRCRVRDLFQSQSR